MLDPGVLRVEGVRRSGLRLSKIGYRTSSASRRRNCPLEYEGCRQKIQSAEALIPGSDKAVRIEMRPYQIANAIPNNAPMLQERGSFQMTSLKYVVSTRRTRTIKRYHICFCRRPEYTMKSMCPENGITPVIARRSA